MANPQKGAIGVKLEVTIKGDGVVVDISTATVKKLVLSKPSSTEVEKTAIFSSDGKDGKVYWTTTSVSDLDEIGIWRIQVDLVMPSFAGRTEIATFLVQANVED